MSNQELFLVNEVTEEIANNLTDFEKENKINQLKTFETQIITGLSDETSIINHVIVRERDFFQTWASTLKQLHYLNYYEEPLNTICSSIFSKIGKMKNLSTDRKENLHRNLRRSLDNEFKQIQESDKMSPQNTSDVTSKESIILEAFESLEHYHSEFIEIIKIFRSHLKDPAVHKDMEAWFDKWEKIARLCEPLSELSGDYSVLKQMTDEGNMRESATLLQRAFAKLLYVDGGFRQMAHGFGVVPRQNQRIRNRDEDWPEKDAKTVIRNVTLSLCCQGCGMHVITGKKYNANGIETGEVRLAGKRYKLSESFKDKNLTPIDLAELLWKNKLLLVEKDGNKTKGD